MLPHPQCGGLCRGADPRERLGLQGPRQPVTAWGGPSGGEGRRPGSRLRAPQAARAAPSAFLRLSGRDRRSLSGEEAGPPVSAGSPCVSPSRWHLSTLPHEASLASPSPHLACLELPSGWPHLRGAHGHKVFTRQPPPDSRPGLPGPLWAAGHLSQVPSFLRKGLLSCPLPQLELKILGS